MVWINFLFSKFYIAPIGLLPSMWNFAYEKLSKLWFWIVKQAHKIQTNAVPSMMEIGEMLIFYNFFVHEFHHLNFQFYEQIFILWNWNFFYHRVRFQDTLVYVVFFVCFFIYLFSNAITRVKMVRFSWNFHSEFRSSELRAD